MKYHPFGDASTYSAIVRQTQPFYNRYPLFDMKGDYGDYSGTEASALRYIEYKLSDICKDLYINGIDDKVLYKTISENLSLLEPKYFIPKLPTALLIGSITVGYGFGSYTTAYSLNGIADLVIDYAKYQLEKKRYPLKRMVKYLRPIFPTKTYVRNYSKLEEEYAKGNFTHPIINDGIMEIEKYALHIYNLPYDVSVANVNKTLLDNIRTKGSWANQNVVKIGDHSEESMRTHIVLYFKRTCDIFDAMIKIKSMISFTGKVSPVLNYSNDGVVTNYTPYTILVKWYRERKRAILSQKKHKQVSLVKKLDKLNVILLVHDKMDRIIEIIRKNTIDDGYSIMDTEFGLTYNQCSILYNAKLSTLSKSSKEDLLEEIKNTQEELDSLLKSYDTIDMEIMESAKAIKNKYEPKDPIEYVNYIGYISVNNSGVIQFTSLDDLVHICKGFPNTDITIHIYPDKIGINDLSVNYPRIQPGVEADSLLPMAVKGKGLVYKKDQIMFTVTHTKDCSVAIEGWVDTDNMYTEYHYRDDVITLYTDGVLKKQKISKTLPIKRKGSIGNKLNIVGNIPNNKNYPKYILVGNTTNKNKIKIHRIDKDTEYIPLYMNGTNRIIGIVDNKRLECINIPDEFVRGNNIRYLWIDISDLNDLPSGTLNLNSQKLGSYSFKTVKAYPQILRIKI
jgi:hypothetical protein